MNATFVSDGRSKPPFEGSWFVVAHYFVQALTAFGYRVRDLYVPVTDKKSEVQLPAASSPTDRDVHVFFEELYPRCRRDDEHARSPNLVFFNLPYFRDAVTLESLCDADMLLFNSPYLQACFRLAAREHDVSVPALANLPLPLPLLDFPRGYRSSDHALNASELRGLQKGVWLGHAMRRGKADPFATLSILTHLNAISRARGASPFRLIVPVEDMPRFQEAVEDVAALSDGLDALIAMPRLDNRALTKLMKACSFSLCYDTFREAFGYYPIESVYLGCPVFTNGVANLRHLLPARHGIEIFESLGMHFGTSTQRFAAYAEAAVRIHASVLSNNARKRCRAGADLIESRHNRATFESALERALREAVAGRQRTRPKVTRTEAGTFRRSPVLRLADWQAGRFVTDWGSVVVAPRVSRGWARLIEARGPGARSQSLRGLAMNSKVIVRE